SSSRAARTARSRSSSMAQALAAPATARRATRSGRPSSPISESTPPPPARSGTGAPRREVWGPLRRDSWPARGGAGGGAAPAPPRPGGGSPPQAVDEPVLARVRRGVAHVAVEVLPDDGGAGDLVEPVDDGRRAGARHGQLHQLGVELLLALVQQGAL